MFCLFVYSLLVYSTFAVEYPVLRVDQTLDVTFTLKERYNVNLKKLFPHARLYLIVDNRKSLESLNYLDNNAWKDVTGVFKRYRLKRRLNKLETAACQKDLFCYKNIEKRSKVIQVDKSKWNPVRSYSNMFFIQRIDFRKVHFESSLGVLTIPGVKISPIKEINKYVNSSVHYVRFALVTRPRIRRYIVGLSDQQYLPELKLTRKIEDKPVILKDTPTLLTIQLTMPYLTMAINPYLRRRFVVKKSMVGPRWIIDFVTNKATRVTLMLEWIHNGKMSKLIIFGVCRNEEKKMTYLLTELVHSRDLFQSYFYKTPLVEKINDNQLRLKWSKTPAFYMK